MDFVQQVDVVIFLVQVEEYVVVFFGDGGKCVFQLEIVIVVQVEQCVVGQVFGMQVIKYWCVIGDVVYVQGYMFFVVFFVEEIMYGEFVEGSWQFGGGDEYDGYWGIFREMEVCYCISSVWCLVSLKCCKYLLRWMMNRILGYE